MKTNISNSRSKLAAVGILIFLLYALWLLLVRPYLGLWEDRARDVEILQRKHAALSQIIKNKSIFDQQYDAITNSQGLREIFLNNKSGALADVKLQRIVKQVVIGSGGNPIQILISNSPSRTSKERSSEGQDDRTVTVKVLMQGSIEAIYTALQQLENSRPLILVSDLEISPNNARYQITQSGDSSYYRARYDATAFIL